MSEWNDAGTKPDHPCLCETKTDEYKVQWYQYFNGTFFGFQELSKPMAIRFKDMKSECQDVQWREVQP